MLEEALFLLKRLVRSYDHLQLLGKPYLYHHHCREGIWLTCKVVHDCSGDPPRLAERRLLDDVLRLWCLATILMSDILISDISES